MLDEQISHYRLVSKLGAGTYGVVYKAVHVGDDEFKVAIKVVQPSLIEDPKFIDSLKAECRRLDRLDHAAVVRFRDLVLGEDMVAMVLELLEGQDLHQAVADGPLPIADAIRITEVALSGLAYAHSKDVVHRDIKPSNIYLCDDGRVKILDFGIARAAQTTQGTQTGTMKGTLDYMAPERFSAGGGGFHSDVYSMGLVAWELVTGRPACPAGDLAEKLGWHLGVGVSDPRLVRSDCPDWLADVLCQLAAKDGTARPADGAAALAAFQAAKASGGALPEAAAAKPAREAPRTVSLAPEEVAAALQQATETEAPVAPRTVSLSKADVAQVNAETSEAPVPEPVESAMPEPPVTIASEAAGAAGIETPTQPVTTKDRSNSFGKLIMVASLLGAGFWCAVYSNFAYPPLVCLFAGSPLAEEACFDWAKQNEMTVEWREDPSKVIWYYEKACDRGHGKSCYNLELIYRYGKGVTPNSGEADRYSDKACAAGETFACLPGK